MGKAGMATLILWVASKALQHKWPCQISALANKKRRVEQRKYPTKFQVAAREPEESESGNYLARILYSIEQIKVLCYVPFAISLRRALAQCFSHSLACFCCFSLKCCFTRAKQKIIGLKPNTCYLEAPPFNLSQQRYVARELFNDQKSSRYSLATTQSIFALILPPTSPSWAPFKLIMIS